MTNIETFEQRERIYRAIEAIKYTQNLIILWSKGGQCYEYACRKMAISRKKIDTLFENPTITLIYLKKELERKEKYLSNELEKLALNLKKFRIGYLYPNGGGFCSGKEELASSENDLKIKYGKNLLSCEEVIVDKEYIETWKMYEQGAKFPYHLLDDKFISNKSYGLNWLNHQINQLSEYF